MQAPPLRLARARLRRLARHRRDAASLDADRRQGPARADALAQPRLARAALRDARAASARRRSTSAAKLLEIEFDFIDHRLRAAHVERARARLRARADVGRRLLSPRHGRARGGAASRSRSIAVPNEMADADPVRRGHAPRRLRRARRRTRSGARWSRSTACCACSAPAFLGKASPVHFFWGSFDLAVTRFSGRAAPLHPGGIPGLPDAVTREAYSHEVSSAGFWPGSDAYPAGRVLFVRLPDAGRLRRGARSSPTARSGRRTMGEWLLPYERVRAAADPDAAAAALPAVDLSRRRRPRRAGIRRSTARSASPRRPRPVG